MIEVSILIAKTSEGMLNMTTAIAPRGPEVQIERIMADSIMDGLDIMLGDVAKDFHLVTVRRDVSPPGEGR